MPPVDASEVDSRSSVTEVEPSDPPPTEEELATLRKVPGSLPITGYLLCAVEFAERASFFGVFRVIGNFIQFPLPEGGNGAGAPARGSENPAGALGTGLQIMSAVTLVFKFLAFASPLVGGYVADTKFGRYKTICIGVFISGIAHLLMVFGVVPTVLQAGKGMAPFIISIFILALGSGFFKSNICPTVIDQIQTLSPHIKTLPSGERVIVDPEVTIQRVTLAFFALTNVGALVGFATSFAEMYVGYWLAYSIPTFIYLITPLILVYGYKRTVKVPPEGSVLGDTFSVIKFAFRKNGIRKFGRKGYLDVAKPSNQPAVETPTTSDENKADQEQQEQPQTQPITWTDSFVDDISRTLVACQIFLFYPFYHLNDGGLGALHNSQAASMTKLGTPSTLVSNMHPLGIVIFSPLLSYAVYPLLRRYRIKFGPIMRITVGFVLAALTSVISAVTQWRIYETSPCRYYATNCNNGTGIVPISIWWLMPVYIVQALSEVFSVVTGYETAYARSPVHMKGLVLALFIFANAIAAIIVQICLPVLVDPYLIWPFTAAASVGMGLAALFYYLYHGLDKEEFLSAEAETKRSEVLEKQKSDDV
ncbi:hypothetical protein AJ80_03563 [Polytolypa hystricis UAMH7299]|uniref:Major facilitator superfamily (MFS) profile domain-containing protein n=1 Tax=Polytolypa hystricis (strain UAMH7299) TaxID=1447883 RepID=A0A2B7YHN1_POLH7|nr:hypothetical protein AJ80_03563 [Polytolypa hystricis UAMH7299]